MLGKAAPDELLPVTHLLKVLATFQEKTGTYFTVKSIGGGGNLH